MNFSQKLQTVENLPLNGAHQYRGNCPFCGGKNTFSVTRGQGKLAWVCFKASCSERGRKNVQPTITEVRQALEGPQGALQEFAMPSHFVSVLSNERAVAYLEKNHCTYAHSHRLANIKYDPVSDRVVFLVQLHGRVVDAVGRALKSGVAPKWYRYGSSGVPFIVGTSKDLCLIVEDAASACAVSPIATGAALMGTRLQHSHLGVLKPFKLRVVALDADATRKALDISRVLRYYGDTVVVALPDDLKYYGPAQIREILVEQGIKFPETHTQVWKP